MGKAIMFSAAILCAAIVLLGGISEIFSLNGTSANTVYRFLLVGLPALGFFSALNKMKPDKPQKQKVSKRKPRFE